MLPMWWFLIFLVMIFIFFSLVSLLSEGIFIPSRSYFMFSKKISSWLK